MEGEVKEATLAAEKNLRSFLWEFSGCCDIPAGDFRGGIFPAILRYSPVTNGTRNLHHLLMKSADTGVAEVYLH